jgi:hypothetical protein
LRAGEEPCSAIRINLAMIDVLLTVSPKPMLFGRTIPNFNERFGKEGLD